MKAMVARPYIATWCLSALVAASAGAVGAQTEIKPAFNLFSAEQDQDIGRQSADAAESQLPILHDRSIDAYIERVGQRLAAVAPGANYAYQFKVVNASDINAFALPGGYLYFNRGLIEAAQNEGQLAGVMAHEMAHVALRHGTSQASKAYLGQAGLGLLGGLIGKDDGSTDQTIAAIGGFGLNALFLKYSRRAEEQADVVGAQILAGAGYDPRDMVDFFEILAREQGRDPSKVEQFFSSHPAPADRAARINEEMELLRIRPTRPVGGFAQVQSELARMRPAASLQQIAGEVEPPPRRAPRPIAGESVPEIRVDRPSTEFRVFAQRDGLFQIEHPDNWRAYESDQGYGVIIAPDGGYVDVGGRERELVSGVIVNHYDPLEDDAGDRFRSDARIEGSSSLVSASNDLLEHILRNNSDMRVVEGSERRTRIDGAPSISVVLSGRSVVMRHEERVTLFAREIDDDHVIYALFVAAERDYERLNETFNRMISSLEVSDETAHGARLRQRTGSISGRERGTVPAGTVLQVSFTQPLSSASAEPGDRFVARVVEPVRLDGRVLIAEGSAITGRVVGVQRAEKLGGQAQLNLEFTSLRDATGRESPIAASFHGQGKGQTKKDAATIGGAAVGGAILGHAIGKDRKGTVLGALIGGAIGTGIAANNTGEEVELPEGMAVEIQLDSPFGR